MAAYPHGVDGGLIHHKITVSNNLEQSVLVVVDRGALSSGVSTTVPGKGTVVLDCGAKCRTKLWGVSETERRRMNKKTGREH